MALLTLPLHYQLPLISLLMKNYFLMTLTFAVSTSVFVSPLFAEPVAPESRSVRKTDGRSLSEIRRGFKTKVADVEVEKIPASAAPAGFSKVKYESAVGGLEAYVSADPGDGKKHPAIIWVSGGFSNSVDAEYLKPGPVENDQSAYAYHKAGVIAMYPSLRGGNANPGKPESLYGEVDDVISAAKFLKALPYVDSERIYLGGHSTGGTLVLLVSESTDVFRAVFSFGPVHSVSAYGSENVLYDTKDMKETELRAPVLWLGCIKKPTFVFEGINGGNTEAFKRLALASRNPLVQFHPIPNADHFSTLARMNALIAEKIIKNSPPGNSIDFKGKEINALFVETSKSKPPFLLRKN